MPLTPAALMQCAFAAQCLSRQRNFTCRIINKPTYFHVIFNISGFDCTTEPGMVILQTTWHQHSKHYRFRANTPSSLKCAGVNHRITILYSPVHVAQKVQIRPTSLSSPPHKSKAPKHMILSGTLYAYTNT